MNDTTLTVITLATATPAIVFIVKIFTDFGFPPIKFAPFVAILLGFIFAFVFFPDVDIQSTALRGLGLGLAAVGLYSTQKNALEGFGKDRYSLRADEKILKVREKDTPKTFGED